MDRGKQSAQDRWRERRRRAMAALFALLPAVLAIGLLAPDFVKIAPAQSDPTPRRLRATSTLPPMMRPPLLVQRDLSGEFTTQMLDVQSLFSSTPFVPDGGRISAMVAFPQNRGELIALDDTSTHVPQVVFRDVLAEPVVARTELPTLSAFLSLANPVPRGNGLRFDDFPGDGDLLTEPIPEPGTALLLGAGLLMLAATKRRLG